MFARVGADVLVVALFAFLLFVALGGLLAMRWRWVAWLHVPAAVAGAVIEFTGWICPLTPLENTLRQRAGEAGYAGGFIDHYIVSLIYREGLTRAMQTTLGAAVIAMNAAV